MIRLNEPLWRIRNVNDTDCRYISHSNLHIRSLFYAELQVFNLVNGEVGKMREI